MSSSWAAGREQLCPRAALSVSAQNRGRVGVLAAGGRGDLIADLGSVGAQPFGEACRVHRAGGSGILSPVPGRVSSGRSGAAGARPLSASRRTASARSGATSGALGPRPRPRRTADIPGSDRLALRRALSPDGHGTSQPRHTRAQRPVSREFRSLGSLGSDRWAIRRALSPDGEFRERSTLRSFTQCFPSRGLPGPACVHLALISGRGMSAIWLCPRTGFVLHCTGWPRAAVRDAWSVRLRRAARQALSRSTGADSPREDVPVRPVGATVTEA